MSSKTNVVFVSPEEDESVNLVDKTIDIVFVSQDDLIGSTNLTFVEIERDGKSIRLGEWIRRQDGYLVLRIPDPEAT